jgi:hypothetical protein
LEDRAVRLFQIRSEAQQLVGSSMTSQTATLIAAAIAATAATTTLIVNTLATGRRERKAADRALGKERREVHRGALTEHLAGLADAIHEVVATSFVQYAA